MYLSGYSRQTTDAAPLDMDMAVETNHTEQIDASAHGLFISLLLYVG